MRRLLWTILGLAMLAAAALLLWAAHGPLPRHTVTTGGVLYTQPELAEQAALGSSLDMAAVTDVQAGGGPALVPVRPQLSGAALRDLGAVEAAELETAPASGEGDVGAALAAGDVALTTDVLLDGTASVALAPLGGEATTTDGQGGLAPSISGYEQRVVELEWPDKLPVRRAGAVRVTLKMLEGGALQPVAEIDDNQVLATPILLTDRYTTHSAFVTATLSAPDFHVETVSNPMQPLARGGEAEWRWTVEADDAQTSVMALGLSITWQPITPDAVPLTNVPIWGQTVRVQVDYVFGLITVPQASVLGTALAVFGFIAQFPLLEELFIEMLFGRRRRRRARRERERRQRR